MKLSELLRPITGLHGEGPWTGRCPAHQDKTASLSISVTESKKLAIYCHAGCRFPDVVQAMGLKQSDFFDVVVDIENIQVVAAGAAALPAIEEMLAIKAYCEHAAQAYPGSDAEAYVETRFGISSELAAELGLGFDDGSIQFHRLSHIRYHDQPRLVVPFKTTDGVIVALQGRRLRDGNSPKWCGPSNPTVDTSWATTAIWLAPDDNADLVICEGAADYLTAVSSGVSTIAIRGASLAGNQRVHDVLLALGRNRRILVAGDADDAGQNFSDKIARFCSEKEMQVHILEIQRGNDLSDWRELAGLNWSEEFAEARRNASLASDLVGERWLSMTKSDDHNGRELMRYVGEDYIHCDALGWLHYYSGVYREDKLDQLTVEACAMFDEMLALAERAIAAGQEADDGDLLALGTGLRRHATNSLNLPKRDKAKLAAESKRTVDFSQLDRHRDLLVASNCVIDLRDGSTTEHDRSLYMTAGLDVPFDIDAKAPRWEKFIDEITLGRKDLAAFLQTVVGYGITARTDAQVAILLVGKGSNGKSVFLNALRNVFEPITTIAAFSTFEKKTGSGGSSDIAELAGARLAIATEGERRAPIAEAVLKRVTGSDPLSAAHKYRDHFTFQPRFLLMLATNYRLAITGQDEGIWRRMVTIPFDAYFSGESRDIFIEDKLADEAPGILAWAVRGSVDWYANGLQIPQLILDAVKEHRDSSDSLLGFIPEIVNTYTKTELSTLPTLASTPPKPIGGTAIYQHYVDWAAREMVPAMSKRALYEAVSERLPDSEKFRQSGGTAFRNVRITSPGVGGAASSQDF